MGRGADANDRFQPNLANQITILSCPSTSATACTAADSLTWQQLGYDGLGRQVTEKIRIPEVAGIVEKTKTTTYNALGLKTSESVWGSSTLVTTFGDYDPFGRVGSITPPGQKPTKFTYEGVRVKTRETSVMTASNTEEAAFTTEIYDARGRLIQVCENQAAAWTGTCSGILTTYLYDVGSRLTQVCSNKVGDVCGQTRRFLYDNRGFLAWERHPEIGITEESGFRGPTIVYPDGTVEVEVADVGNDRITYTYDALGNVLTKDVQGSTEFDLTYHYDSVGRLIRLDETNGGAPRPLKEFFYARSNSGTDLRAGKLVMTKRHNWVDIVTPISVANSGQLDAVISESFRYEDAAGRVSARQTRFSFGGTTFAFDMSQTYDELGNVASITYPSCIHDLGECAANSPSRTVTYTHTKGFQTAVPGFADSIAYQAGGMLHQIRHANGVTYTVEINAANGIARPHKITTTAAGFSTGVFDYDGAGNVYRIGSLDFRYDRLNRLVSGEVQAGGSVKLQTAAYDDYGNLTQLVTNGITQNIATDTTSNRILGTLGTYDGAGNLSAFDFGSERYEYEYDGVNMMKHLRSTTDLARIFLYNAADERIAQFDCATNVCETSTAVETWTLRGLDDKVLRTYVHPPNEGWQWKDDYVYGPGGQPIAVVNGEGTSHLHGDHLGSVRQVTNSAGIQADLHAYYPFGQEATNPAQNDFALKFTGHERDTNTSRGALDYMHARYCSPQIGRFVSLDPFDFSKLQFGTSSQQEEFLRRIGNPSTLNRFIYANNNPLKYVDPNGESAEAVYGTILLSAKGTEAGAAAAVGASATSGAAGASAAGIGAFGAGALVVGAAGVGVLIGTGINNIPGVSEFATSAILNVIEAPVFADNNRKREKTVEKLINQANIHLGKISTAGGPEKDPALKHHKSEIKAFLNRATKLAKRLPRKLQEVAMRRIEQIADKAGIDLAR